MTKQGVLGNLDAAEFLRDYWQRKPLLVRGALPDYAPPLTPDELAGLALDEAVESRIVTDPGGAGNYRLQHGPFEAGVFEALPETEWTLLVQAIDLWVPEVEELVRQFDFLPRWRIDDVMASFAVEGGSVGPHVDQYDVFLIQVEGQRRWQIGSADAPGAASASNSQLSLVDRFQATDDWVLNPGDLLYLPPGVPHWGLALNPCVTYSVGFRSPSLADMLGDIAVELIAQGNDAHYCDPPLTPAMASSTIHPDFIAQVKRQLMSLLDDDDLIADWLARFMTAPKYPDLERATAEHREAHCAGHRYVNGDIGSV